MNQYSCYSQFEGDKMFTLRAFMKISLYNISSMQNKWKLFSLCASYKIQVDCLISSSSGRHFL